MSRVVSRLDLRLLPLALATWASCAWALANRPVWTLLVAGLSGGLAALGYRYLPAKYPAWRSVLVTGCLGVLLGVALAYPQLAARAAGTPVASTTLTTTVTLTSYPKTVSGQTPQRLWATGVLPYQAGQADPESVPVRLFMPAQWASVSPGQEVTATVQIRPAEPGQKAQLIATTYTAPEQLSAAPWWHRLGGTLRRRFLTADHNVPSVHSALVAGLIIGADDGQSEQLAQAMRTSGLMHLTAVSGSNTAAVVALAWCFATFLGAPTWLRAGGAVVALAGYVVVVGPEPSLFRAAVMGCLGLVGVLSRRSGRHVNALAVAIVVLCALDPWLSRALGFTLSVVATLAILLLGPVVTAWLVHRGVPRLVAAVMAMSIAATVVCAPIVAVVDQQVSLIAVLANVLVAPLVPLVTVVGLLVLPVAAGSTAIATAALVPAHVAAQGIELVAYRCAALPLAALPVSQDSPWWVLSTVIGLVVLGGCGFWWRRIRPGTPARSGGRAAGVFGVLTVVIVASFVATESAKYVVSGSTKPPPDWLVVVCDVGQGSAVLVRTAADRAVLFDTGPPDGHVLGCIQDAGVKSLDALILSHFHQDHVGATKTILATVPVASAWVSAARAPAWTAATVLANFAAHQVPVREPQRGDRMQWGSVQATMLTNPVPLPCAETECSGTQINDQSIVVRFDHPNFSAILTGDIELASQDTLIALTPAPKPVDLLLTPHHGSVKQRADFLALWEPRVHIVCVGADNDYGHPHHKTLATLAHVGGMVLRTDQHGQISLTATSVRHTRR